MEQNNVDIRVIIGNPPYSVGQTSGNDNNANVAYPTLDASIERTYAQRSVAGLKRNLYDSYVRAIRWASNRVLTSPNGGIICYVSHGGYLDSKSADGLRKTLTGEFHDIYVYNLRGNARSAGEMRRKEKDNIFGEGSKTTVAITLLIKRPEPVIESVLHYKDIGDYLDRQQKLELVEQATLDTLDWETVIPNKEGDWINQRDPNYENYPFISDRNDKTGRTIFKRSGPGLVTNRDSWVYSSSSEELTGNVSRMMDNYNAELSRWNDSGRPEPHINFIDTNPTKISWSRGLRKSFERGKPLSFEREAIRTSIYRPFQKQAVYMAPSINESIGQQSNFFPSANRSTIGFYLNGVHAHADFAALAMDEVPCLDIYGKGGQFFARHYYAETNSGALFSDPNAQDNITDWALSEYRKTYGNKVSKDDIFYYTYGLLHSREYRECYESDLRKALPRIPQVPNHERFEAFVQGGRDLVELHISYEKLLAVSSLNHCSWAASLSWVRASSSG